MCLKKLKKVFSKKEDTFQGLSPFAAYNIAKRIEKGEEVTETLIGGFVYKYPFIRDGILHFPDNVRSSVAILTSYKTEQEKLDGQKLYEQIHRRTVDLQMVTILVKVNKEIEQNNAQVAEEK